MADTSAENNPFWIFNSHITGKYPSQSDTESNLHTTIEQYQSDNRVKREHPRLQSKPAGGGTRKQITEFSANSKRKLAFTARNLTGMVAILHLTYPADFPTNAATVQRHWERMRKYLVYKGVKGLVVREFQKRGAIHMHVFLSKRVAMSEVGRKWFEIVASGDEKHLEAGTRVEAIRSPSCLASYNKDQQAVPEGFGAVGRFWSLFGGAKVEPIAEITGTRDKIEPLVETVKGLAERRLRYHIQDNKTYGLTLYNAARVAREHWQALEADCDNSSLPYVATAE